MRDAHRGTSTWRGAIASVALAVAAGCANGGGGVASLDGGGRGTGVYGSTISGNIAPSTAAEAAAPVCAAIGTSAMVSVRGTNLAAPIEADCSFEITGVASGDITLDFEAGNAATSLTLNDVPDGAMVVLRDVRLRAERTDVSGIQVVSADPSRAEGLRVIADPPAGRAPLEVHFFFGPRPQARPVVQWRFGDRSPASSELLPTHVYRQPGEYVVRLRAALPSSAAAEAFTVVRVRPAPVNELGLQLAGRPASGAPPLTVTLRADVSAAVAPVHFRWDFGDGTPPLRTDEATLKHEFNRVGEFLVVVTVYDATGTEAGDSFPVVADPAVADVVPTTTQAEIRG